MRVLLVDDQTMVRRAFGLMLSVEDDIELVGECANGTEAVAACEGLRPDIALMDIEMPEMNGIDATREVVAGTDTEVIVLTTFDRDDYLFDALEAGAAGFLLKNAEPEKLLESIRTVASGAALLAPEVTRRVIQQAVSGHRRTAPDTQRIERLSERELEVLTLMARGLSNAEIAADLFLGGATVKTHVSAVLGKLGVRDRVQAVIAAFRHGIGH
ncbi:MAG: response regulator [Arachnia sp.]